MKKISCIIPAYNEEKTITEVIKTALQTPEVGEVIVINDGSKDNTLDVISNFSRGRIPLGQKSNFPGKSKSKLKIINLPKNQGKGYAVVQGIKQSKYDYLVFLDADLVDLKPYHLSSFITPLLTNNLDMTIALHIDLEKSPFLRMGFLPFCGQRCLKKKFLIPYLEKLSKSKYGLEVWLNQIFQKKKVIMVPLFGIKHKIKQHKEDDWIENYAKEVWQVIQKSVQAKSEMATEKIKKRLKKNLAEYLKINTKKLKEYLEI